MNFFKRLFKGSSKPLARESYAEQAHAKSFEGATTGQRLGHWGLNSAGPNTAISDSLSHLRSRSRDLTRNNPWIANGFRSLASNLVGCGITPRWVLDDRELKAKIQQCWLEWTNHADLDGRSDFYGLQLLIAQTLMQSGEALIRVIPQRLISKTVVPLQLQVIEPDFLVDDLTLPDGQIVKMGIELNKQGKRVAYHLYESHPGELDSINAKTIRIPAKEILHVYRLERPGQLRGVPWVSSVLLKLRELDQYEDAELARKKTAAMFAGFITGSGLDFNPKRFHETDEKKPKLQLAPNTLISLAPGESITFSEPADVGGSYEVWMKQQLRGIAAGIGVTYEQLSGDLHGVNYSSIRAGLIEFRRNVECLQHHLIIHQLCQPVVIQWMNLAVLSGALDIPDYFDNPLKYQRIQWQPPGWDWVDPLKDIQAEILAMQHNLKAREDIIAKYGMDAEEVDQKIAHDKLRTKDLEIKLDEINAPDPDE